MSRLVPLFVACIAAFAQSPAVTDIFTGTISHSIAVIKFSYSGHPTYLRMRYIRAPATCTSMSGGTVQPSSWVGVPLTMSPASQPIGGLSPATTYNICPEISSDGSKWVGGKSVSVTTLPLPTPHPALPIAAKTFDTNYPNTAGFTTYIMNDRCLDSASGNTLQRDFNVALTNQKAHGTVILIPAGVTCVGQIYLNQLASDIQTFASSAINTSTNRITLPNHGFNEGEGIKFGTRYASLPNSPGNGNSSTQLKQGWVYYACNVTANTFQVCNQPIAQGGTPFVFTNAGSASGTMLIAPWPRNLHWIIVRTGTPDNEFVPPGVRLQGPIIPAAQSSFASTAPVNWAPSPPTNWLPKMAVLRMPNTFQGTSAQNELFATSDADGNIESMNGYIRFVGIQFTYTPTPETGSNVTPHFEMVATHPWNDDVIFDRCWFHSLPPPDRTSRAFWWNGMNMAIINSYIDNMQFYHPVYLGGYTSKTSSQTFTINPFTYNWGKGKFNSANKLTVTTTGTSAASKQTAWNYVDPLNSKITIVLPPGLTGTCTGGKDICNVVSGAINGVFNVVGSMPGGTGGGATGHNYWVEPVFSTTSGCTASQTLLSNDPNPGAGIFASGDRHEVGVRFTVDRAGFVCGVRYFRNSAETGTHIGALWNEASASKIASATFARETSSGWQTVNFSSPIAVSPGTTYIVSYGSNAGLLASLHYWQNYPLDNQHLHAPAHYVNSKGSYNYDDNWPKNWLGNTSIAQLSYLTFAQGAIVGAGQADAYSQQWDTEGCQCMVGGLGPGPYIFSNNFLEATGTVWHHDDSGGYWAMRGDYTYTRNYAVSRKSQMANRNGGNPEWDGLQYAHRHMFEWKSGCRINFSGNVYGGSWLEDTPLGDMIEFLGANGCGISDVNVQYNTFAHSAELFFGPSTYPGGAPGGPSPGKPGPALRFRFQHNLVWDINANTWCAHGFAFCTGTYTNGGWGVIFNEGDDDEDWIVDHNTIVGNQGQKADFLWTTEGVNEGFNITNNILYIAESGGFGPSNTCGMGGRSSECYGAGRYCGSLSGLEAWNCALTNSQFDHNLLMGAAPRRDIQRLWPNGPGRLNYVPNDPTDFGAIGWFSYNGLTSVANDYRLKSNYCSGCGRPANDGTDVGADIDKMQVAQGIVLLNGSSAITSSSAQINFVAPDSQGCPVDYSSTDATLTKVFTRITDAGGKDRVRKIVLTGLASGTTYFFRVNCQVQQPNGQFHTQ